MAILICPCGAKSQNTESSGVVDKSKESGFYYAPSNEGGLIWVCKDCNAKAIDLAVKLLEIFKTPHILLPVLLARSFVGWTCIVCLKEFSFRKENWIKPEKKNLIPVFSGSDGRRAPFVMTMNMCKECNEKLGEPEKVITSCQEDCKKARFTKTKELIELKGTYPLD